MSTEELPIEDSSEVVIEESFVAPEAISDSKLELVVELHAGTRPKVVDVFVEKYIDYQAYLKSEAEMDFLVAMDQYLLAKESYQLALAEYERKLEEGEEDAVLPTEPVEPVEVRVYVPESVEAWKLANYVKLRAASYPSKEEQLDMQYHDAIEGTSTWTDTIQSIKLKYPKPE